MYRYIRSFGKNGRFNTFPFCPVYREEDIKAKAEKYGFKLDIPDEIISTYNIFDKEHLEDYNEIINTFKEIDKEEQVSLKFIIKDKV